MRKILCYTAVTIIAPALGIGVIGAVFCLTCQADAHRAVEQAQLRSKVAEWAGVGRQQRVQQQDKGRPASEERHRVPEMKFIKIQKGTFMMGSKTGEKNERPVHQVTISHEFELQETEVTQAQWEALMESNPSAFRGAYRPVEKVSWDDCQAFISKLNARQEGYSYRLPTEAEWEYACRAGTTTEYAGNFEEMFFYDKNSGLSTHPVGSKRSNNWGLYDMHGNVWEWVQDWYGKYQEKQVVDPQGPPKGSLRVLRGGGWHSTAEGCRSAFRLGSEPNFRNSALGFRLARVAQ